MLRYLLTGVGGPATTLFRRQPLGAARCRHSPPPAPRLAPRFPLLRPVERLFPPYGCCCYSPRCNVPATFVVAFGPCVVRTTRPHAFYLPYLVSVVAVTFTHVAAVGWFLFPIADIALVDDVYYLLISYTFVGRLLPHAPAGCPPRIITVPVTPSRRYLGGLRRWLPLCGGDYRHTTRSLLQHIATPAVRSRCYFTHTRRTPHIAVRLPRLLPPPPVGLRTLPHTPAIPLVVTLLNRLTFIYTFIPRCVAVYHTPPRFAILFDAFERYVATPAFCGYRLDVTFACVVTFGHTHPRTTHDFLTFTGRYCLVVTTVDC